MDRPEHVDTVVVGSGFGGAVTACRLAEAGQGVLVLERGRPYPPGSFPRGPRGLAANLWDPSEGLHGMFDLWSFEGLEALVASGLGGGSLIYANVLIRKDPAWFADDEHERWPLRYEDLEPHYERVEHRLGATPYPVEHEPYASTPKTEAFRGAAQDLGADWFLPNLAVTFAPAPGETPVPGEPIREARPNLHGRTRVTCRLVGECDVGCNAGAKNSLDFNYLTDAWHAGAEIRTRCEVRAFEPGERGGWIVHYVEHDPAAEGTPTDTAGLPRRTVTAERLVLAAGTLGTTYLLLRNRAALPGISPALGTHFSGNGDLLTFAVRCSQGKGRDRLPRYVDPSFGPVITSAIRVPDAADGDGAEGRGFYLEDAGVPEFATWLLQAADTPRVLARMGPAAVRRIARRLLRRDPDTNLSAELAAAFGDCGLSSGVLPLLGMGRDVPDGRMRLEHGRLQVDWRKHGASAEYFDRVRAFSKDVADRLGGEFLDNVLWRLNRVVTVHALGGAPMGRDREEGVVDVNGEVFGYPGLHVADGAVMPGPVGANPSLTIAAIADRCAEAILEGRTAAAPLPRRFTRAERPTAAAAPPPASEGAVGLAFTEQMKGHIAFGEPDPRRGAEAGERLGTACMFELRIATDDLDRFIADPDHPATATGIVRCEALGGERRVLGGWFNLFVGGREKRMLYRLHLTDGEGHPVTLVGHKRVVDDAGVDNVWADTSTLYTTLLAGHVPAGDDESAPVLAAGILRIKPLDFARQLTTFDTTPDGRFDAVARFGALFAGQLWEVYGPGAAR